MEKKQKKFKFNVIDVIVILVLLVVVVFFAVRFINFEATAPEPASSTQVLRYTVRVDAMPASVYEEVSKSIPSQMLSAGARYNGVVLSVTASPAEVTDIEVKDGSNETRLFHMQPQEAYYTVDFVCEAEVKSALLKSVGSQEVRVGRTHFIKTEDLEFVGTVTSVELTEDSIDALLNSVGGVKTSE